MGIKKFLQRLRNYNIKTKLNRIFRVITIVFLLSTIMGVAGLFVVDSMLSRIISVAILIILSSFGMVLTVVLGKALSAELVMPIKELRRENLILNCPMRPRMNWALYQKSFG